VLLAPLPAPASAEDNYAIKVPSCPRELPVPWQATLPLKFPRHQERSERKTRIPKIVHFIFGYKVTEVPVFSFTNYIAVASARAVLRPEVVMIHCLQEPVGFFWELVRPHVRLVRGREITDIFGNEITHYAHKADIVRLEALLQFGGIYLDIDVVVLKPMDSLLNYETVMGEEGEDGRVGLCNAVILAAPESRFVTKWYEAYKTFNREQWNYHSVVFPKELAKKYPELIEQRMYKTFHWPLWDEAGIKLMMDSYEYDYADNFAVHVWNHGVMRSASKGFSMPWCYACHSTLVSTFRAYVPDPLFSVIIHCADQAEYVHEAMASVLEQTFPSWEIILVDDASTDDCGWTASAFAAERSLLDKGRFKLILNSEAKGVAQTRNIGIREARGVWILALDAADKVHKDYLRAAAEVMSLRADTQLISSNQKFFDESSEIWNIPPFETTSVMVSLPLPSTSLYLRSSWETIGGYTRSLPWGNGDYDFWLSMLELGVKFHKLQGELVFYRYSSTAHRDGRANAFRSEVEAMMRSRHPSVFHVAKMFREHRKIMNMTEATKHRLKEIQSWSDLGATDRAYGIFWLALADMQKQNFEEAANKLSKVLEEEALVWQPGLYHAFALCRSKGPTVSAPLLQQLSDEFPELRQTTEFVRIERNCRGAAKWETSKLDLADLSSD